MKNLFAVIVAAAIILNLAGCVNTFGVNDNPPMLIPTANDRLV